MHTPKYKLLLLLPAVILGLVGPAARVSGDEIQLKNGRSMEGIVVQERESEIVLDLGVGQVTLKRSRIASIKKSSSGEKKELQRGWKSRYVIHEKYAPEGFDDLVSGLAEMDRRKKEAVASYRRIKQTLSDNAALQRSLASEQSSYVDVSRRLKQANPKADLYSYNRLVQESNRLSAALVVKRGQLGRHQENLDAAEKRISAYQESLAVFAAAYEQRRDNFRARHGSDKASDFFNAFDARLAGHRDTIQDAIVPHDQYGQHMVVPVRINDRLTVRLMVDTGASLVVLPQELANRLGARSLGKPIDLTMADGSVSKGTPVVLDEVVVGEARAHHVQAVLIEQKSDQRFDGLLGMSFLKHFTVSYNPVKDELLLRSFKGD